MGTCVGLERYHLLQFLNWGCAGLERTDFFTLSILEGCRCLERLIFTVLYLRGCGGLNLFFHNFNARGCGGLERNDFETFVHLEGVVVLKELIFNSSTLGMFAVLEKKTDFNSY